jgi:hypothetical protein
MGTTNDLLTLAGNRSSNLAAIPDPNSFFLNRNGCSGIELVYFIAVYFECLR